MMGIFDGRSRLLGMVVFYCVKHVVKEQLCWFVVLGIFGFVMYSVDTDCLMMRKMMRSDSDWCIVVLLAFVESDECTDRRNLLQRDLHILVGLIVVLGYMLRNNQRGD